VAHLEAFKLNVYLMATSKLKILTLDGGGIRGIIPCAILAEIERRTGRPVSEMFDLIAGTSTGGIIACGMNVPHPDQPGKPKYSAAAFGELYEKNGAQIFKKRGGMFSGMSKLFEESFGHEGLEELLLAYFGDIELRQTRTELLITSYDIERRKPFYFLSRMAKNNPGSENFRLRDIARSTSAAPTYFEPNSLPWTENNMLALVDGGVFANNPSMLAYAEAVELLRAREQANADSTASTGMQDSATAGDLEAFSAPVSSGDSDIFMLSIGTGRVAKPYRYEDAKSWGMTQWLRPIIDILMQGVSETVDYQMQYVLPPAPDGAKHYVRINPDIPEAHAEMSDVSEENIRGLQAIAQKAIDDNNDLIEEVCRIIG
jgi:patatin-like phospholipase/acyl hydrolase